MQGTSCTIHQTLLQRKASGCSALEIHLYELSCVHECKQTHIYTACNYCAVSPMRRGCSNNVTSRQLCSDCVCHVVERFPQCSRLSAVGGPACLSGSHDNTAMRTRPLGGDVAAMRHLARSCLYACGREIALIDVIQR